MAGVSMSGTLSGLVVTLTHGPSGAHLRTVPPRDNGGDGSSFSPTDLVGAALAACALATLALKAPQEGLAWGDASATVEKHMVGPPRRIGKLELVFHMPPGVPVAQRARLEEIARTCPVALSLGAGVEVPMAFRSPGA
jgi:putative redox protein